MATVSEAVERGVREAVEIVFDEHSLFRSTITAAYDDFRANVERDPQRLAVMPVQLGFRDDQRFVILQAADLLR